MLAQAYTPAMQTPEPPRTENTVHTSRLQLIWDVVMFQFKLLCDAVRDVLLSPLSIIAAVLGLLVGGDDPHRYLRRLLRLGRRSDMWINLFGQYRRGTSDQMVDGLRERVFTEATSNPWLHRAGSRLNQKLDDVNASHPRPKPPETGP
jgi:hypothetical protein